MKHPLTFFRLLVLGAVLLPSLLVQGALANTTTSVPVTVSVTDVGELDVSLGSGPIAFLTSDGSAPGVSSTTGAVAYADVDIVISDSRSDGARDPYIVSLSMTEFTHVDGAAHGTIGTNRMAATAVAGLPDGMGSGIAGATPMTSPVVVVNSGDVPAAGTWTVTVTILIDLPAGTVPGDFNGGLSIQVDAVGGS